MPKKVSQEETYSPEARVVMKALGTHIKNLRGKARGQTELAERANMDQGSWSRIERGMQWVGPERLFFIAQALEVAPYKLFGGLAPLSELPSVESMQLAWKWEKLSAEDKQLVNGQVELLTKLAGNAAQKMQQQQPQVRRKRGGSAG
jgi:transcriptional regulator with XRE-family HTH domain